ncbi:hypothetical protein L3X38_009417 [Prunus dulcis]|uniref:Uncharacterized protein n=1 Tax=Prunus dulcis TaxID=3755 RepID=A0AAD4ZCC6_PRUDU|nr:hypothetical protein L3X38_009417 [Prunus dulcis]
MPKLRSWVRSKLPAARNATQGFSSFTLPVPKNYKPTIMGKAHRVKFSLFCKRKVAHRTMKEKKMEQSILATLPHNFSKGTLPAACVKTDPNLTFSSNYVMGTLVVAATKSGYVGKFGAWLPKQEKKNLMRMKNLTNPSIDSKIVKEQEIPCFMKESPSNDGLKCTKKEGIGNFGRKVRT